MKALETVVLVFTLVIPAAALILPATASSADFDYDPPGQLVPGSGQGRVDNRVYLPGMRFPIESSPAFSNSQVYRPGGYLGPGGGQCDSSNYSYPWQDNFCEIRRWTMPYCPSGTGHQGQDIRPATCSKDAHWTVAAERGTITGIGSYSVTLQGESSGIRHRYLHLNHSRLAVSVGSVVEKGQRIGLVSDNFGGTATTIHLHYDMYSGGRYIPTYMSLVKSYEEILGTGDTPTSPSDANTHSRAVTAAPADFDGDGFDDIFWYRQGDATDYIWYARGRAFDSVRRDAGGEFTPIAGDYNGDGLTDIFWYRAGPAIDYLWISEGRSFQSVRKQIQGDYLPISGDFDGNGSDDIFWYRPGPGGDSVFYADGRGEFTSQPATVTGEYIPVAGDFDNDGRDDIFWYRAGSDKDYIWKGRGSTFVESPIQIMGSYDPVAGDFNADALTDIFWYASGSAADYISYSTGTAFRYSAADAVPIYGSYEPIKGDFDGDGYSDIFWYQPGAGRDFLYFGTSADQFDVSEQSVNAEFVAVP